MTAHFDLRDSTTSADIAPEPTGRPRAGRWLPIGLVAAVAATIGGVAALNDRASVELDAPAPAIAATETTRVAARPVVESAIIRAERMWAGDEFDLPRPSSGA